MSIDTVTKSFSVFGEYIKISTNSHIVIATPQGTLDYNPGRFDDPDFLEEQATVHTSRSRIVRAQIADYLPQARSYEARQTEYAEKGWLGRILLDLGTALGIHGIPNDKDRGFHFQTWDLAHNNWAFFLLCETHLEGAKLLESHPGSQKTEANLDICAHGARDIAQTYATLYETVKGAKQLIL